MSYATYTDVERYSRLTFTAAEQTDVTALCADASAFMEDHAGSDNLLEVAKEGSLRLLCCRLVIAIWNAGKVTAEYGGVKSVKIGDFSASFDQALEANPALGAALDRLRTATEAGEGVEVVELDLSGI